MTAGHTRRTKRIVVALFELAGKHYPREYYRPAWLPRDARPFSDICRSLLPIRPLPRYTSVLPGIQHGSVTTLLPYSEGPK
jgi:hypothetical protein